MVFSMVVVFLKESACYLGAFSGMGIVCLIKTMKHTVKKNASNQLHHHKCPFLDSYLLLEINVLYKRE